MLRCLLLLSAGLLFLPLASMAEEAGFTLHQSIQTALRYNPRIEVARQQCLQSQGRYTQARAGYLPQLNLDGTYGRTRLEDLEPLDEDNLGTGAISASQLIYDFGRTTGGIDAGRYDIDAARYNFTRLLQNVVFEVKLKFYLVLEKRWLVDVARLAVENFEQHADRARELFTVGVRTKIDVTNAEVTLSNARLDLLRAESNLQAARVAFVEVLGRLPYGGRYTLVGDEGEPEQFAANKPALDQSLEEIVATAMENHPALQQIEALTMSAESLVSQARGDFFPAFNVFAGYNAYETDLPNLWNQWRVGLGMRWNLFSGFQTTGKVAEANARLRELKAGMRDRQVAITKDATESYLRARENSSGVDIAAKTFALATENLEVAEGRYKEGLSDVIEFNDAQFSLTRSQSNLLSTYYAYLVALARIELATGVVPEVANLPESVFTSCAPIDNKE